jgi:hypothetical protein
MVAEMKTEWLDRFLATVVLVIGFWAITTLPLAIWIFFWYGRNASLLWILFNSGVLLSFESNAKRTKRKRMEAQ